ncbi:putative ABC transport system substrate-binding protein [Bradyrhizobium sp. cir1]|uniref:ABC transporter substrate-binding protein n=1 Tax=Bradyrhizobium sp. cir1 TaxID=1445730 RepID=UPI001605F014|nr:ABC transporter substrate-binding protein [Bradyrhizobium sp. cir1]MBB4373910.1 putative ABC transport system substrate-binding protein [Bradyrhizobium sp. cir1]
MRRREFIALLGTTAMSWTRTVKAQSGRKIARIGVLWHAGSAEEEREYLTVLVKAFSELGYVEGKNVEFLHKFPAEQRDRFPILARELVESNVDVAIAVTIHGAVALKQITSTIPVVFVVVPDPIGLGLVASLAHPGGSMTGLSMMQTDLSGKFLALLKEAVPNLSSVALFRDSLAPPRLIPAYAEAAKSLGLVFRMVEVPSPDVIEQAFAQAQRDHVGGVVVVGVMMFNERARVGAAALAHRMPAVTVNAEAVPYGLLMSYGSDFPDYFRRAAGYADKILRGAKPADLPVEQPTRLKQVINLKVAKALGLTIPPSLLVTADEVIE